MPNKLPPINNELWAKYLFYLRCEYAIRFGVDALRPFSQWLGVNYSTVSRWLNGQRRIPTIETIVKIGNRVGIDYFSWYSSEKK